MFPVCMGCVIVYTILWVQELVDAWRLEDLRATGAQAPPRFWRSRYSAFALRHWQVWVGNHVWVQDDDGIL